MIFCQNDSDSHYSDEALQMIHEGTDAKIDDEELLGSKKGLTTKGTPIAIFNALQQKWHLGGDRMKEIKTWESKDQKSQQSVWHFCYEINEIGIFAQGSDFNKRKA